MMESVNYRAATFFETAAHLGEEGQKDLIKYLRETCAEEEANALIYGIGYFRMLMNKDLHDNMCRAMALELYKEFNKE